MASCPRAPRRGQCSRRRAGACDDSSMISRRSRVPRSDSSISESIDPRCRPRSSPRRRGVRPARRTPRRALRSRHVGRRRLPRVARRPRPDRRGAGEPARQRPAPYPASGGAWRYAPTAIRRGRAHDLRHRRGDRVRAPEPRLRALLPCGQRPDTSSRRQRDRPGDSARSRRGPRRPDPGRERRSRPGRPLRRNPPHRASAARLSEAQARAGAMAVIRSSQRGR